MKRPLSIALAAALAVSALAISAPPAAAQGVEFGVGVTNRSGEWHNGDDWRWRHGHRRHHFEPGFSFSFGVPFPHSYAYYRPRHRDCFRDWDGALVCRRY